MTRALNVEIGAFSDSATLSTCATAAMEAWLNVVLRTCEDILPAFLTTMIVSDREGSVIVVPFPERPWRMAGNSGPGHLETRIHRPMGAGKQTRATDRRLRGCTAALSLSPMMLCIPERVRQVVIKESIIWMDLMIE
ncbi:unnamed protein product [Cercospora beticola]|nr:unnamed protein product [Cercospora beticola]